MRIMVLRLQQHVLMLAVQREQSATIFHNPTTGCARSGRTFHRVHQNCSHRATGLESQSRVGF